jgi:hypothetical protein
VKPPGLLRQAEQLEDVRKAEGVKRTFELHVRSRSFGPEGRVSG